MFKESSHIPTLEDLNIGLKSGMEIPSSTFRITLDEITGYANSCWNNSQIPEAISWFDKIAAFSDIEIIEKRDPEEDYSYRCAEYAFTRNGNDWFKTLFKNYQNSKGLWTETETFLKEHGYISVDTPRPGDIIGYGLVESIDFPKITVFEHFGIYEGDGVVTSKFGTGHVFRHPWSKVPLKYGGHVAFFRKEEN
jgi:hypothetical protein